MTNRGVTFAHVVDKGEEDLKSHIEHLYSQGIGQNNTIEVNFGLLLQYRIYELDLGSQPGCDLEVIQSLDPDLTAVVVDGSRVLVQIRTHKPGYRPGVFGIRTLNDDKTLMVRVRATVMSKGSGTPHLQSNVRCLDVLQDDDDDETEAASDWQGF